MNQLSSKTEFKLDYPVDWNGQSIGAINVRRPKGRDNFIAPKGGEVTAVDMYPFFANLCSMPNGDVLDEEFLHEMDAADLNQLAELIFGFMKPKKKGSARRAPAK